MIVSGFLRRKKLPIGSEVVENTIRRVIPLRFKGPGMFWNLEHAEAVIYLRAHALTERWDELLERVRKHTTRTHDLGWQWEPGEQPILGYPEPGGDLRYRNLSHPCYSSTVPVMETLLQTGLNGRVTIPSEKRFSITLDFLP
jgi:hypothetical protein